MTISVRTQKRMKTQVAQKQSDRCTRRQPRGGVAPFGHKQRYAAQGGCRGRRRDGCFSATCYEKTRAIADDSTDSAGFTCPVGMRLTALFYSILPTEIKSIRHALLAEVKKLFQAFLLHHIGHPVIGNIDRHLETRRGEKADLLQALGQLPLPFRVKARFSYDLLHGYAS